jgi:hypothetical protein
VRTFIILLSLTLASTQALARSDAEEFCSLARELDNETLAPFSSLQPGFTPDQLSAATEKAANAFIAKGDILMDSAPDANLRTDLSSVLEAYRAYSGGNKGALTAPQFVNAGDRVQDWLHNNCGLAVTDD